MPTKLNIAISGAGIGGLTTAIALRRAGHSVTIYERSSLSHEIGQGITLSPNGGRILKQLGLDFNQARVCDYIGREVSNAHTLEQQLLIAMGPKDGDEGEGSLGMKAAYRIDLHAALVRLAVRAEGEGKIVRIVTGAGVRGYDGEEGKLILESGEVVQADLLVAAGGVKSSAAAHLYHEQEEYPQLDSTGTIVYRFTLPADQILSDPLTKPLLYAGQGVATFYVPPGAENWIVRYWCRDDGFQNFSLYCHHSYDDASSNAEAEGGGLRFSTSREEVLKEMEGFHPALKSAVEMCTDVRPLWRCTTREPLRRLHRGRMVAIGDAAHVVKPVSGFEIDQKPANRLFS